ncbi:MAG TPA: hypothetical protein VN937_18500 [Blastocatellia bacterium]|nr:hypothetical protein [Blastocatellia bacterium]
MKRYILALYAIEIGNNPKHLRTRRKSRPEKRVELSFDTIHTLVKKVYSLIETLFDSIDSLVECFELRAHGIKSRIKLLHHLLEEPFDVALIEPGRTEDCKHEGY